MKSPCNCHTQTKGNEFRFYSGLKVAHSLEDPTVPIETIKRRAGAPVENVANSFHDDYTEANAKFRAKAGLEVFIIRTDHGGCCDWCRKLAGKYRYPDEVPKDIYHRHDNWDCSERRFKLMYYLPSVF